MRVMRSLPFLLTSCALALVSCTSDKDDTPVNASTEFTTPDSYSFSRSSAPTVDFSGQTIRISMLEEMGSVFKTAATDGTVVSKATLSDMYENKNNRFVGAGLNDSKKQLKDKTAASLDYFSLFYGGGSSIERIAVLEVFENTFTDGELASQGSLATEGFAGKYIDGTSKRLFATNGLEPQQVFLKGMMGACLLDQVVNNYLSVNKLDGSSNKTNNTDKVLEKDTNFTTMEHNWDEAYGYIYGADNTTVTPPVYKFWSSYINQVNADSDFNTVAKDIETAFRTGRAAIVANNYEARDAQIKIIKKNLALIPAVRSVFYLQEGKAKLGLDNGAKAFHALSEAYGFIMCLRYTNKPDTNQPYFSKTEVDSMLASLIDGKNGLWDIDSVLPKLDTISTEIATRFGFTVAQAATIN